MAEDAGDDSIHCAWNGGAFMIWIVAALAAAHHPYLAVFVFMVWYIWLGLW